MNYYNEFNKEAAQWLRELITEGLIPPGEVDERSITEVRPDELRGYTQCHFFAGIGGWSYALQLAGWQPDVAVWTGSCPCQPFSVAGKGDGNKDERHLWPEFYRLIAECRPPVVFGEQVPGAIRRGWLDGISDDLESQDYACGAVVLPACSVGSPHIRQRIFWVAESESVGRRGRGDGDNARKNRSVQIEGPGSHGGLDDSETSKRGRLREEYTGRRTKEAGRSGGTNRLPNSERQRCQGGDEPKRRAEKAGQDSGKNSDPWQNFCLIDCKDGKTRRIPVEPAFFPLAHGVSGRVAQLRGLGNAIVPQVATEFIKAYMEI